MEENTNIKPDIHIRPVTLKDTALVIDMWNIANKRGKYTKPVDENVIGQCVYSCVFNPAWLGIVVEVDGKPVGWLVCNLNSDCYSGGIEARSVFLWIHPGYRNLGCMSRLVDEMEDWAREQGACRVIIGFTNEQVNKKVISSLRERGLDYYGFWMKKDLEE